MAASVLRIHDDVDTIPGWVSALGLLLGFVTTAAGAGSTTDATVVRLSIVQSYGDIVFVKLDKPKDNIPNCHTNLSWDYVMTLETELDKKMYALLLTARASQAPLSVSGKTLCYSAFPIELLEGIWM